LKKLLAIVILFTLFEPQVIFAQLMGDQGGNLAILKKYSEQLSIDYYRQRSLADSAKNAIVFPLSYEKENGEIITFDKIGGNNQPQFLKTCNNYDAAVTVSTNKVWPGGSSGLNLSGANMNFLGIWDGGKVRSTHIEMIGRVIQIDSATSLSSHSTAVAGNMIASGILPSVKGMSFQTNLKAWDNSNDNSEIALAAGTLLVSNHSYANIAGWYNYQGNWYWYGDTTLNLTKDSKFGYYDYRSRIWDSIMYAAPYYLMVKAAGNDRGSYLPPNTVHYYWNGSTWVLTTTTRDTIGPYDCVSTFGNAKNSLTIGAINVLPNGYQGYSSVNMLSFSSWGPTDDGRIKPDLVGASGSIYSTSSANDSAYGGLGGTSIAAPNITGSLLLLQQHFHNLKGRYMLSSTLKGLAIHTAEACKLNQGPNYESGWGLMNTAKAANHILDSINNSIMEIELNNNDTISINAYYKGNDSVKVTICWTDPAGILLPLSYNNPALKLINDLDLRLISANGNQTWFPYILNPANPSLPAMSGDNFRDNVEQIKVDTLVNGFYKLRVTHKNLLQNQKQVFSLLSSSIILEPDIPSSNISFSNISNQSFQLSWLKGNGKKRIVVARANSAVNAKPINGVSYSSSGMFGNGYNLGNGNFVVFNDTGNAFTLQGLTTNTSYYFSIFEYNGDSFYTVYQSNVFNSSFAQTLPVKWLSFTAQLLHDKTILLKCSTASEENTDYFEIERSINGFSFERIAEIKASFESKNLREYSYRDKNVILNSTHYYRLKLIDVDGKYTYSKTVFIKVTVGEHGMVLYPNPVVNMLSIELNGFINNQFSLRIFDISGKTLYEKKYEKNEGKIEIDASSFNSGVYMFELITDDTRILKRFVK